MSHARNRMALLVALTVVALGIGIAVVITVGSGPDRVAAVAPAPTTDTVSVSGNGSVEGVPDTLVASLRVHAREAMVQQALTDTSTDAREVITALTKRGVAASDIRTTDLSVNPDYGRHDEIIGYDSSESLTVRIHPLSHVGRILSAAAGAAGNSVSVDGLSFDIADNTQLLAAARATAFANAKAAATQYAELSSRSLDRVISVRAVVTGASPITRAGLPTDGLAYKSLAASIPIRPGQKKVGVTVKVVWALQ